MKTGRPKAVRSALLAGWESELAHAQARAIRAAFLDHVAGADDADQLNEWAACVVDLHSTYSATAEALSFRIGAKQELCDLAAIADDADGAAEASKDAPRALLSRLRRRLSNFPPFSEPRIAQKDVEGHFARMSRIRAALALWNVVPIVADLRKLAADCRACPAPPRMTKPSNAAAYDLQREFAAMAAALPLLDSSATGQRALVEELTQALGLSRSSYRPKPLKPRD